MHLSEALELYLEQIRADGRSEHTVRQYRRHVRLLGAWLAGNRISAELEAITTATIAKFLTSDTARRTPSGTTKLAASLNALRTSIKTFFAHCELAGYIDRSPGLLIRRARCGEPPVRALNDDEVKRLLEVAASGTKRDEMLVRLLLGTGLRIGEALSIEVGDIDLARGVINVRRVKGDRRRTAFIPAELVGRLAAWIEGRIGRIFAVSARHAQRQIARLAETAEIAGASAHSLRHSLAQKLYRKTGDIEIVRAALGHASIGSTARYARAEESAVRRALGA